MGKTTIAALLAQELAERGYKVYAIDADPDANLASMLGVSDPDSIRPIVEMKKLIKERVGATSEDIGSYFTMNPRVDDIPEKYGVRLGNIRLLVMGHIPKARGGCACPENIFLRELVSHALTQKEEIAILDMEAGIEHLGRGTAQGVDVMLIVVEPSKQSIETAKRIQKLAVDLGVPRVAGILNKMDGGDTLALVEKTLNDLPVIAVLPQDYRLRADSLNGGPVKATESVRVTIDKILEALMQS